MPQTRCIGHVPLSLHDLEHSTSCDVLVQVMVGEPLAAVRCVALRCLGRVLEGVESLPPSDAKIFNECAVACPFSNQLSNYPTLMHYIMEQLCPSSRSVQY